MADINAPEDLKRLFLRCTHINFHIIACLRAKKALDDSQVSQLSGENSLFKRSQMIFDWMENNQSFRDIVRQVMNENEQQHVSNLLQGIQNGPHIPLSLVRYYRLESITPKLMLTIRNDEELIAKLREKSAISEIDRQDITQKNEEYKRNWNLIEAIRRRSDYAFDCFEQALKETLQDHAANYLNEGQMIAVHAKTTQPEKDDVLSDLLNKVIIEETKDVESSEEKILTTINGYNIHPVATKPGQSIVFFLYCKTVDNVITFTELFISGDLQSMIEVIMNRLLLKIGSKTTKHLKARLRLDDSEILDVERFSGIEDWMPVELEEATSISLISEETQTEHQQPEKDTDVSRKQYWKEERKSFHQNFQSLLAEEEELLTRFLPETAASKQERNWTQRRNTLSEEFEKLMETQNCIFKSLITMPKSEADTTVRIYELKGQLSKTKTTLRQQQDRWRKLKYQVLQNKDPILWSTRRRSRPTRSSTPRLNRIDLHLQEVQHLRINLETTKGDIFFELENLQAEGKILEGIKEKPPEAEISPASKYSAMRKQHRQQEFHLLSDVGEKEIREQRIRRELLLLDDLGEEEFLEQRYLPQFKNRMSTSGQLRSLGGKQYESQKTEDQVFFVRKYSYQLAEILDLDSTLLPLLFEKEVLNSREYVRIRCRNNRFDKNEALLSTVAQKTPEDIKEFQDALAEALQSEKLIRSQFVFPASVYVRDAMHSVKRRDSITFISGASDQASRGSKSPPVIVDTIWMTDAKGMKRDIRGLTILDRELFVVNERSSEVEVYDRIKSQNSHSRKWQLEELIRPQDIGSCSRNKCLYILDCKVTGQSNEIMKVDPNGKLIKTWSTGVGIGHALSVTDESNVILTFRNNTKLNEYSSDGQWIRKITLSSDLYIRHLCHAIKMTNGDYVVSHGALGDHFHEVCIVDADGKTKKSFGGAWESPNKQLNGPVYLALDENGFVMVADRWNSRVLLLDPDLQFQREIISKETHGLRDPTRILLDKSSGQLLVADNTSGSQRILIINLK